MRFFTDRVSTHSCETRRDSPIGTGMGDGGNAETRYHRTVHQPLRFRTAFRCLLTVSIIHRKLSYEFSAARLDGRHWQILEVVDVWSSAN
jgi:hypothetical protein